MPDASSPNPLRKFAVQKPKGKKWETLALVDDLDRGLREFRSAIGEHGAGYVRLIQIDFKSADALSDYDWHLIELHDPHGGKGRPKPTLIAGTERAGGAAKPRRGEPQARKSKAAGQAGGGSRTPGKGAAKAPFGPTAPPGGRDRVPVPYATYLAAILFGALVVAVWVLWFKV